MPDSIDEQLAIADVYAAALLKLAQDANAVEEVRDELEQVVELIRGNASFAAMLKSDAIDADRREASLEKIFRGRISDTVMNTLAVMNRHGRSAVLPFLLRCYVLRQEEAAGQVAVTATSAVELSDEQRAAIEKSAAELSGKTPVMKYVVARGIIGGLILQIGDLRYDNSVRRQLRAARTSLLERSSRGFEAEAATG